MRIRIIVGIVLLPILPLVLFFAPEWVLPAVIALISAVSVWELLGNTRFAPKKRIMAYAAVFSACVPFWYYANPNLTLHFSEILPLAGVSLFLMLLFLEAVADHKHVTFSHIGVICTTALSIPVFFSSLIRIMHSSGKHYILLPFIAALLGDTCAYFVGVFWGKHKLKPDISPKKTIEGAIGGFAGVLLGMAAYGILEQAAFGNEVNFPVLLLFGLLGSFAAQLGDLSMSLVKREFQIKDFGNLLPGHGGVLDRFDSLLFAAPVIEILIALLPAAIVVTGV